MVVRARCALIVTAALSVSSTAFAQGEEKKPPLKRALFHKRGKGFFATRIHSLDLETGESERFFASPDGEEGSERVLATAPSGASFAALIRGAADEKPYLAVVDSISRKRSPLPFEKAVTISFLSDRRLLVAEKTKAPDARPRPSFSVPVRLVTTDLKGGDRKLILDSALVMFIPKVSENLISSPDGCFVALRSVLKNGSAPWFLLEVATGRLTVLGPPVYDCVPCWSPDNRTLAMPSQPDRMESLIYRLNDKGRVTRLDRHPKIRALDFLSDKLLYGYRAETDPKTQKPKRLPRGLIVDIETGKEAVVCENLDSGFTALDRAASLLFTYDVGPKNSVDLLIYSWAKTGPEPRRLTLRARRGGPLKLIQ